MKKYTLLTLIILSFSIFAGPGDGNPIGITQLRQWYMDKFEEPYGSSSDNEFFAIRGNLNTNFSTYQLVQDQLALRTLWMHYDEGNAQYNCTSLYRDSQGVLTNLGELNKEFKLVMVKELKMITCYVWSSSPGFEAVAMYSFDEIGSNMDIIDEQVDYYK